MRMSDLDRDKVKAQRELEKKTVKFQREVQAKREIEVAKAAGTYLGKRKVK